MLGERGRSPVGEEGGHLHERVERRDAGRAVCRAGEEALPVAASLARVRHRGAHLLNFEALAAHALDRFDERTELRDDVAEVLLALRTIRERHVQDDVRHVPLAVVDVEPFHEERAVVGVRYKQVRFREPEARRVLSTVERGANFDPRVGAEVHRVAGALRFLALQGANALARAHGCVAFGNGVDHIVEAGEDLGRDDDGDPDRESALAGAAMEVRIAPDHHPREPFPRFGLHVARFCRDFHAAAPTVANK